MITPTTENRMTTHATVIMIGNNKCSCGMTGPAFGSTKAADTMVSLIPDALWLWLMSICEMRLY